METNHKRTAKVVARLKDAQDRFRELRRDGFTRSEAVVAVHGEFPQISGRGNFTRWLGVMKLEKC